MSTTNGAVPRQPGIAEHLRSEIRSPLFLVGDSLEILR
jgi:hypothetical protein